MLKELWSRWEPIATKIGNFQARVILSLLYVLIVTPFGLAVRFLSDPLRLKHEQELTFWQTKEVPDATLEQARRQF